MSTLLFKELFFKPQPAMQFNNTVIYLKVDFLADLNFVSYYHHF